jgi:ribosomal protein S18 acetylase RimI-like enzyme
MASSSKHDLNITLEHMNIAGGRDFRPEKGWTGAGEFGSEGSMIIRPAQLEDAAGIAKVRIDTWRTTYRNIVPAEFLDSMSYEEDAQRRATHLSDPESKTFSYVAENDEGQIVGFVAGGPERNNDPIYKGELYAIYILQSYHGQGIGRQLTNVLVEKLLQIGIDSMILWVFADNPARRFYEALGGKMIKESQFEIAGVTRYEVAYGWLDIRTILKGQ